MCNPAPKSNTTIGTKQASYSDSAQLRGFLKGQIFGTIPELTPVTISNAEDRERTVIITGANSGLGFEAAKQLIEIGYGSRLILACRNISKGKDAHQKLRNTRNSDKVDLRVWQLDMASKASITAFVDRVDRELDRVDAVILNAGVDMLHYQKTAKEDGEYEMTLMVNVVGTMLLATLLVPVVRHRKPTKMPPRITIVGSAVQFMTKYQLLVDGATNSEGEGILEWLSKESRWKGKIGEDRYFLSKGILQMVVRQLAARIEESASKGAEPMVIINCAAPGLCKTELFRDNTALTARLGVKLLGREGRVGARSLLVGAIGITGNESSHGGYMTEGQVKKCSSYFETAQGEEISRRIWHEIVRDIEAIRPGTVAAL